MTSRTPHILTGQVLSIQEGKPTTLWQPHKKRARVISFALRRTNARASWALFVSMTMWLLILAVPTAYGQFLRIEMDVETELGATHESNLSFGKMSPGIHELHIGDDGAGVFSLSAYENVYVKVSIQTPEYLIHSTPAIGDRLRTNLKTAYANRGENNYRHSIPMSNNQARFRVREASSLSRSPEPAVEVCWLYVYGTVHIGNVMPGVYVGEAVVRIEYE